MRIDIVFKQERNGVRFSLKRDMNETDEEIQVNHLITITLTVNKATHRLEVQPNWTLAEVLRDKLGLTGTKIMCDTGDCGSCTVLLDGKPTLSCLTLAAEVDGKEIITIEGLKDSTTGELHPIQKAFIERSGFQCGICTPGFIVTAKALLDENKNPTEDEVREALSGNLCRCGTYFRIVECVLAAAKMMREGK